jgi:hypothetical protein
MSNTSNSIEYPHFISSKPHGKDMYEGKSQERLMKAIANHIHSTDKSMNKYQVPRIIGLEGTWGAGKSNVIKQLITELNDDYYIFEYDAWGHQEDLQRRSFLETLTTELIKKRILIGNISDSINNKVSWNEKLNNLLAKKVTSTHKSIPKFNKGALYTAIALSLTPISSFVAERLEAQCIIKNIALLSFLAFSPIIVGILLWLILMRKNKDMRRIEYLLQISKDQISETTNYETINEDEPTVAKFKKWMQDISDFLINRRKLIIVFDNMDRLPAEKVKELWSSIHTFFSEDGFDNIWTIIPFDEKHLSCAFGENETEDKKKIELTKYFIEKTFPVVFRVAPPVITDSKKIFNDLFEDAFGNIEINNQHEINRIFRVEYPNATIRDMIVFINQLVSLKSEWDDDIGIFDMAIFALRREAILENPVKEILSGEYLGNNLSMIIKNDTRFQRNIAALVYGVSPEKAEQIPLSRYIENCLKEEAGYDINQYSSDVHFIVLLDDAIRNADVIQDDSIINVLSLLDTTKFDDNNKSMVKILWNFIADKKMKIPIKKQEFDETFQKLLPAIDRSYQENIIRYFCDEVQYFEKFKGNEYYLSLNLLEEFLLKNKINIPIKLNNLEKSPEIFIDYAWEAEGNYLKYKLIVSPEALDNYFVSLMPEKLASTRLVILEYIDTQKTYALKNFAVSIETAITNNQINEKNIGDALFAYKNVCHKKPLPIQLNDSQRQALWNSLSANKNIKGYYDLAAMQISKGVNISNKLDNNELVAIAECMDYYSDYGKLLIYSLSVNIPSLNQILKYMTEHELGYTLSFDEILPQFSAIIGKINVPASVFLKQLNDWENNKGNITKDNIQTLIPSGEFFKYSVETKNDLTDHINKTMVEAISSVDKDAFYQQRINTENDYWFIVIKYLIGTEFMPLLPENLTSFGVKILDAIASGEFTTLPASDNVLQKIIDRLEKRKTAARIKDIRDKFCKGDYNITPQLFVYFESWFAEQGDLKGENADRVAHCIIQPVINDDKCLDLMLSKQDYYSEIIINADDDATELKEMIRLKLKETTDERLILFSEKIGVTSDKENS